ncbi:TetR/AcrR family transcriptional regulator [Nocardiopsis potens]|uniref:TetR/AcrR family transcriptional regulator n=1 Tax=Nocardiopsis potens TaxID=1246458 RepID=UPI0003493F42|nr:TetR/AcrR family transcriptional regulator [Nocardiopsis potens]
MTSEKTSDPRRRILEAAAGLLAEGGAEAASTRAVAAAAGVQAPTLYRLFGDKQGLLDALAAYGFERYLADKQELGATDDPVADLRRGWDLHVDFGLARPALYVLMYGTPRPGRRPAAADDAYAMLCSLLERVARAGRLRLPVPAAARMVQAANTGAVLTLIASAEQDEELSPRTREAVLAAITAPSGGESGRAASPPGLAEAAVTLDAVLDGGTAPLTPPETALLREWLHRLAAPAD